MILLKMSSIVYVLFFAFTLLFRKRIRISKSQMQILLLGFALSLAIITFYMSPPSDWDIVRHFTYIDTLRQSGRSLGELLFPNKSLLSRSLLGFDREFSSLYTYKLLIYIVIKLTDNNYFLPALCVFIDYIIFGYIVIDWQQTTGKKVTTNLLTVLLALSFLPFFGASSGLRNALCASVLGLAVYLYLYKRKKLYVFIILSVIACTIHPAAIMTIPFVFIARLDIGIWGYIAVFVASVLVNTVAKWMSTSSILFLRLIGQKYYFYTSDSQYRGNGRAPLYTVIFLIIIFLMIYFSTCFKKGLPSEDRQRGVIYNFLAIYMVYILGNIGNYDMVLRPAYVLGPLSPVLCSLLLDGTVWRKNKFSDKTKGFIRMTSTAASFMLVIYLQSRYLPELLRIYVLN